MRLSPAGHQPSISWSRGNYIIIIIIIIITESLPRIYNTLVYNVLLSLYVLPGLCSKLVKKIS